MHAAFRLRAFAVALVAVLTLGSSLAAEEPCPGFRELAELVDPLSQADEWLGHSVAIDGRVAVVGVHRDQAAGYGTGRVLVYEREAAGWVLAARLRDDVVRSLTEFGFAVDVEGGLIAVAARADDELIVDAGAVHLYRRQPDGSWAHVQRLHASDAGRTDFFGHSVALDGGRLAIGCVECINPSEPLAPSGAVYVFEDDGTGRFVETARLAAPVPQVRGRFGHAVALDDGILIVGEPGRDVGSRWDTGTAHAFVRLADGSWSWEAELSPSDREEREQSGTDVSLDEGLVAVGLRAREGPVRLWRRSALGDWSLESELPTVGPRMQLFGISVALSGGRLAVGTVPSDETLAALLFESDGSGAWTLAAAVTPEDFDRRSYRSLDLDEERLVVGSAGHVHGAWRSGGAWIFGCDPPPDCDAGPEILEADCDGMRMDGSGDDPLGRELSVFWTSDCPDLVFSPSADRLDPLVLLDSVCERECELTLEVTADDGTACSDSLLLRVDDARPPELFVPSALTLECSGEGGIPASDPRVAAWLGSAGATDSCRGVEIEHDAPVFFASGCRPGSSTTVRFIARDECGNEISGESELIVIDSMPPVIEPGSEVLMELWAPNHRHGRLSAEALSPSIADLCDSAPAEWRFAACLSDEPADGRGDGQTEPDCLIAADGLSLSLRAERSGRGDGRFYEISIVAGDACGNWSAPVAIGSVLVRHDQRR